MKKAKTIQATYVSCKKCGTMISREILAKMKTVCCPYCKEPDEKLYDLIKPPAKDEQG